MMLALALALGRSSAPAGTAYDPVTALGDDLYEDWSSGDGVTLDGGTVSSWAGRKNGWAVTQSSATSRPAFSATAFYGAPGITPDGLDDYLEAASIFGLPFGADPVEIWLLYSETRAITESGSTHMLAYGDVATTTRRLQRFGNGSNARGRLLVGDGSSGTAGYTNSLVDLSGRTIMRGIITGSDVGLAVNGAYNNAPAALVPATANTRLRFFAASGSSPTAYGAGVYRRVLFTKPLTTQQADDLTDWLSTL